MSKYRDSKKKGRGYVPRSATHSNKSRTKPDKTNSMLGVLIFAIIAGFGIYYFWPKAGRIGAEVQTPSGLKYVDLVTGTGASPSPGKQVTVHYTGTLENGTKFDSSVDRGQPFTFVIGVGGVIKGWDEGVMTMKVGGTRKLIIPGDLGYGPAGSPPK
ncbi:MAG: FKBP-type peptidyl-prolyl cis-trans isomerase, partial [Acidobacteriota bacterium]|nr:FKBP-type peptidyl-prolyl cis-trans isomerase [Acidobacteriota bacterium]